MDEIEMMFNRVGLLGVAVQTPSTGGIIEWKPMEFTAEKQLEIIKWLGERNMLGTMRTIGKDKDWIMTSEFNMSWGVHKYVSKNKSFEETLAELINFLWQNLPQEEKQQIKEILNG